MKSKSDNRPNCKDCYWFEPDKHEEYAFGECRINAPNWPTVSRYDWCGEWDSDPDGEESK